ncbi:MAG: DUF6770 family protein [Bacteroidia bacterium]
MKKIIKLLLIACMVTNVNAQTTSFTDVDKINLNNFGYILDNGTLSGYYTFYQYDKIDRHTRAYWLPILDNNLKMVKKVSIERPKNSILMESVFNGSNFAFVFWDRRDELELITYDKTGTLTGSHKTEDLAKIEKQFLGASLGTEDDPRNITVFSLGQNGFLRQTFLKNDKTGYLLEAYDNSAKPLWNIGSDPNSKFMEIASVIYSSDKYILANVDKAKGMTSNDPEFSLLAVDATNGKKIFDVPANDATHDKAITTAFFDEDKKEIIMVGEYYVKGSKILKTKSIGMYVERMDMTGKELYVKKLSWNLDLKKFIQETSGTSGSDKEESEGSTFFHKIVRTKDGGIIAIGEKYKKSVSGWGVASALLNGTHSSTSVMSIKVDDMVAVVLDPSFNLAEYKLVEKQKSEVTLPQNYGYISTVKLGYIIKMWGGFDYSFSTFDKDANRMVATYIDYGKMEEGDKKKHAYVGNIIIKDKVITTDKFPLPTDATKVLALPAKPGDILFVEYYRKKKTINMRLEKVNF